MEALNDPAKAAFARAPSPVEGCLRVLGLRARDPSAAQRLLGRARLVSVHANDMGASAVVQTPGGGRSTVEVENVGGDWRVARGAR